MGEGDVTDREEAAWPLGPSEMARRVRDFPWSSTPLGPITEWHDDLKATVQLMLDSGLPMMLAWGETFIQLYNDALVPLAGEKHPSILGRPIREAWPETWSVNGPIYTAALSGETLTVTDMHMTLRRNDRMEEAWFCGSFSPWRRSDGAIGGVFVTVQESTDKVLALKARDAVLASLEERDRRNALLLHLSDRLRPLEDPAEIVCTACGILAERLDVDRAYFVEIDEEHGIARVERDFVRQGAPSLAGNHDPADFGWSVAILRHGEVYAVDDARVSDLVPDADRAACAALQIVSCVGVPLNKNGRLLGALCVTDARPRSWSDWEVDLVRDVGERIWSAVEHSRAEIRLSQYERMEALGQLTGGVAHDFNNLLTVISGNLELAEGPTTDERTLRNLRHAQEAVEMGASLNHRLLTFARRAPLKPQRLRLSERVDEVVALLSRTIGDEIEIATEAAPDLWPVMADPGEIDNAIVNIAINARDAMPDGGRLTIATSNLTIPAVQADHSAVAPGDYACLTMSDTGTGMPPEILRKAAEPFFTTKAVGRGTGLGLSSIEGFVRQSGGCMEISSEVGTGTTVRICLPRAPGPEGEGGNGPPSTERPMGQAETILVVDDNEMVLQVTRARLEILGYTVVEAKDGPSAVATLEANGDVRLVISDVLMPGGMSGYDLAGWIRDHGADVRVLLSTGYSERAGSSPHDRSLDVLRKPYSHDDLARAVRTLLDG